VEISSFSFVKFLVIIRFERAVEEKRNDSFLQTTVRTEMGDKRQVVVFGGSISEREVESEREV